MDAFAGFLAPGIAKTIGAIVVAPAAVGELSPVVYQLVKGVPAADRPAFVPSAA